MNCGWVFTPPYLLVDDASHYQLQMASATGFTKHFRTQWKVEMIFMPPTLLWDEHPDRDKSWFEKETRNMSRRDIAQELECSFLASGESVIHPDDIGRLEASATAPKYQTAFDRNLWIWEEYQPGNTYLLVADVARGDGKDFSVFNIVKLETMEVVAEYQGKPNLDSFAALLSTTGREFGGCMLVVENNNIGFNILEKLIAMQYPNLYYSEKGSHEYVDPSRCRNKVLYGPRVYYFYEDQTSNHCKIGGIYKK